MKKKKKFRLKNSAVISTTLLVLSVANSILSAFGKSPLPISNEQAEMTISTIFTAVSSVLAWYTNNFEHKE